MIEEKYFEFDNNINRKIIKNIRKYRKEKGYTQEQLALMSEISYDFMRKIETGKCGFSVQTLYKISVVLDTSVDILMGKE